MRQINIIGGITTDIEGNPYGQLIMGESNPGKISMSYGGVGRNITENLARLGAEVGFVSVAGDDFTGRGVIRPGQVSVVSVTGAGDAFSAAILDGFVKGMNVEETAKYGMAAASIAMESKTPVNPKICFEEVMRRMGNE